MKHFDIIILGGGASGCMTALISAPKMKEILIIDKQNILGKKLLVTGNGRCNITNINISPSIKYFNQDINIFLEQFPPSKTLGIFNKMGLICYNDDEGRVYPITNSARSVVDVINNKLTSFSNVVTSLENEVLDIKNKENHFIVYTQKDTFTCEKLVIATGGKSVLDIIGKFRIPSNVYTESLVALKTDSTHSINGIRVSPVKITAKIDKINEKYVEKGEILFKESGISGIVAFNCSSFFARNKSYNGNLEIDLLPDISENELIELLIKRRELNLPINKFFDGLFLPQLAYYILNKCKINENRLSSELKVDEIHKLASIIKNLTFKVKSHYDNNQVYSGGIKLSALNNNLECKTINNLYFCGEICDVDGICGGYNLQWAWTSGAIVGENL